MSSKNNQSSIWDDPEFQNAIKQIRQISQEDYPFTKEALETTESNLNELERKLSQEIANIKATTQGKAKAETAKEVTTQLEETKQDLDQQIKTQIKTVHEALEAKKSSLDYFTIAFMGKTKAGKSTLHSILTEQEWDSIGVGKQRTTRSNRIYTWNNIRMIDTPGIGAPGGKTDEETTLDIIDEADLIIFVVTNDSQQESEFQFLKLLKEKAKPLCILINVLKNFNDPFRGDYELKRFLKNPERLFDDQEMQGHFNRIQSYARKYYENDYFSIVPVMFLAAQLSYQEKHQQHKKQLWEASRIENFLEQIRLSIVEQGTIRRSQNLLGSSVKDIEDNYLWAQERAELYHKLAQEIREKSSQVEQKIDKAMEEVEKNLKNEIAKVFKELKNSVPQFAEDYWNSSEEILNQAWTSKLRQEKYEEKFNNISKQKWNNFTQKVQELLEEIGKDLQFSAKLGRISGFQLNQQDTFDFRNLFRFAGGFLAIGLLIPGMQIIGIAGLVMNLVANLFESKADKRRKAVQKISQSLNQQINQQELRVTNQIIAEFRKNCNQVKTEVKTYLEQLMTGLDTISKELKTSKHNLEVQVYLLNFAYGKRIIDWSQKRYEPLNKFTVNSHVAEVKRQIGQSITIKSKNKFSIACSQKEMDSILQETVTFYFNESRLENKVGKKDINRDTFDANNIAQSVDKRINDSLANLNKLLTQEQWKEAEIYTFYYLFGIVNLGSEEMPKNFTYSTEYQLTILEKINQLWRRNSGDRYGLVVQRKIYKIGNYLPNWYKVSLDRKQNDQELYFLYSKLYLDQSNLVLNLVSQSLLEEGFANIQTKWEKIRKDCNEEIKNMKDLEKQTINDLNQGNNEFDILMQAFSNNQKYQEKVIKKQDKLKDLVNELERKIIFFTNSLIKLDNLS